MLVSENECVLGFLGTTLWANFAFASIGFRERNGTNRTVVSGARIVCRLAVCRRHDGGRKPLPNGTERTLTVEGPHINGIAASGRFRSSTRLTRSVGVDECRAPFAAATDLVISLQVQCCTPPFAITGGSLSLAGPRAINVAYVLARHRDCSSGRPLATT